MNFEYTHTEGGPTDPFEVAVIKAGYKWVRTNSIVATRPGEFKPDLPIDRLNSHKHSGHNTHLIVEGDLSFDMDRDFYNEAAFKRKKYPPPVVRVELDAADPDRRKEFPATREHQYKATSRSGCSFVEGHHCLSPATAERFMDRGTLRAVPVPLPDSEGEDEDETPSLDQDEIRALLRRAKWYPRGIPSVDNQTLKPEMVWEEDADVEKPRTLRNGKIRPELNPTKDKSGFAEEKATSKPGDGKQKVNQTPATANAKKLLADWFKKEWDDHSRTNHRKLPSVRYDDLYHYEDDQELDDEVTATEGIREDPQNHDKKAEQKITDNPKSSELEKDEIFEMDDV
ncbi:hypothetical protein PG984_011711 [Apiospora sp. TS-2023a]